MLVLFGLTDLSAIIPYIRTVSSGMSPSFAMWMISTYATVNGVGLTTITVPTGLALVIIILFSGVFLVSVNCSFGRVVCA